MKLKLKIKSVIFRNPFQKFFGKKVLNQKGMTLIEIMIVLAILASIMAILGSKFVGAQDKARIKEAKLAMGEISKALSMYYTDCGKYPASLELLIKPDPACASWGPTSYLEKKKTVPKDPWGNDFVYELNGSEFTLKSYGKDGVEGGDGLNADITLDE